jgi:hypothetical protein
MGGAPSTKDLRNRLAQLAKPEVSRRHGKDADIVVRPEAAGGHSGGREACGVCGPVGVLGAQVGRRATPVLLHAVLRVGVPARRQALGAGFVQGGRTARQAARPQCRPGVQAAARSPRPPWSRPFRHPSTPAPPRRPGLSAPHGGGPAACPPSPRLSPHAAAAAASRAPDRLQLQSLCIRCCRRHCHQCCYSCDKHDVGLRGPFLLRLPSRLRARPPSRLRAREPGRVFDSWRQRIEAAAAAVHGDSLHCLGRQRSPSLAGPCGGGRGCSLARPERRSGSPGQPVRRPVGRQQQPVCLVVIRPGQLCFLGLQGALAWGSDS